MRAFEKAYNLVNKKNHLIARLEGIKNDLEIRNIPETFKRIMDYADVMTKEEKLTIIERYKLQLEHDILEIEKEIKAL